MAINSQYLKSFYESYPPDKRHLIELCLYPGAGHLIEPPYSPMARSTMRYVKEVSGIRGKCRLFLIPFHIQFKLSIQQTKSSHENA